jgi:hypothetical protein
MRQIVKRTRKNWGERKRALGATIAVTCDEIAAVCEDISTRVNKIDAASGPYNRRFGRHATTAFAHRD